MNTCTVCINCYTMCASSFFYDVMFRGFFNYFSYIPISDVEMLNWQFQSMAKITRCTLNKCIIHEYMILRYHKPFLTRIHVNMNPKPITRLTFKLYQIFSCCENTLYAFIPTHYIQIYKIGLVIYDIKIILIKDLLKTFVFTIKSQS